MLRNYIRIALRNIRRQKLYSAINVGGLALGLAVCWLIALFILNEFRYDSFHEKKERLARLTMEYSFDGTVSATAVTGTKPGPQFQRSFPEVESYCRAYLSSRIIKQDDQMFEEPAFLYADSTFFQMFSFPVVKGALSGALASRDDILLSESMAVKYFGKGEPVGRNLQVGDKSYTVSGVFADVPASSQIKFDFVTRFENLGNMVAGENWWTANWITYLLIRDAAQIPVVQEKINSFMKEENTRHEARLEGENYLKYHLQPIADVHLHSNLAGFEPNGNIRNIYAFGLIGFLILVIACANYTNLATAQALARHSEMGVRKAMGATRFQLFTQFLGESACLAIVAGILAMGIALLLLPVFSQFTGRSFGSSALFDPALTGIFVLLVVLVAILSGLYPAWFISGFSDQRSLAREMRAAKGGSLFRRVLIVFQFSISVFLIIYTGVILQQMQLLKNKDLGYDRQHVIALPVDAAIRKDFVAIRDAIAMQPQVLGVTAAYETPEFIEWGDGLSATDEKGTRSVSLNALPVDLDFAGTLGMQFVAGRDFIQSDFALMDTSNGSENYRQPYIINESLADKLGWTPEEAIGKTVERDYPGPVVGVVKDFHFESLHEPIKPLVMFLNRDMVRTFLVRVEGTSIAGSLAALETLWKQRVPHRPFQYKFLDDNYNALYESEQRNSSMLRAASGMAVFLACIGLFGLAAYAVRQRQKEIGIRRVLGAGVAGIAFLMSGRFLVLVFCAIVIAVPAAWYAGNQWLQEFSFRITIGAWLPLLASAVVALMAFITVAFHAVRSAITSPVKTLRTE